MKIKSIFGDVIYKSSLKKLCDALQEAVKKHEIEQSYSVENANTDIKEHCAVGVNLATLDWCMREWQKGYKILIAEFEAKDIAAIPTATDGIFRVSHCQIVGEVNLVKIGLMKKEETANV